MTSWRAKVGRNSSSWLITINTNKQPTPELEAAYDSCLQAIFKGNNIAKYITVNTGDPSTITRIDVAVGEDEYGSQNRLHNHTTVSIPSHDCKLSLNYNLIRQTVVECLSPFGVSSPHVDGKLLRNDIQLATNYARKTTKNAE